MGNLLSRHRENMSFSIMVPVYKDTAEVAGLLKSLAMPLARGVPVFITDDGSPNYQMMRSVCSMAGVTLLQIERRREYQRCRALNHSLRLVETPYVLQLDQDKHPSGSEYWNAVVHFCETAEGPACLVGPITNHYPRQRRARFFVREGEIGWAGAFGGNILYHTECLRSVGGFDEEFDGYYGWQDIDVAYRMHRNGSCFFFESAMSVMHVGSHGWKRREHFVRNHDLFVEKHGVSPRGETPRFKSC